MLQYFEDGIKGDFWRYAIDCAILYAVVQDISQLQHAKRAAAGRLSINCPGIDVWGSGIPGSRVGTGDGVLLKKDANTPDPVDVYVGRRLRLRREILRMSQEQVANAIGVTFQQIQKYEQGRNRVSASRLYDICHVLNIHMTYLFQGLNTDVVLRQRNDRGEQVLLQKTVFDGACYMEQTETLELVRSFWRIPNTKARQELLELIQLLGRDSSTC